MSCVKTKACDYKHCITCSEYEVSNLTTTNNICQYCKADTNDFVLLNETTDYSGIEISLNRQGILRIRYYEPYEKLFSSQDFINVKFCPICGRKFDT